MAIFVGVDGGATRLRALVVDGAGAALDAAEGPGALADARGPEAAARAVSAVVREALAGADLDVPADALWAGLAGAGREDARGAVEGALLDAGLARRVRVGTDAEAALEDAFGAGPGILLLAGTGSMALGRTADGDTARVGGWGAVLGDEGSGYALGVEALRRMAHAADGRGPATAITPSVLRHLGLAEPTDLVTWSGGAAKADIAGLAPLVAAAAARGDEVAGRLVGAAVEALVAHVHALARRKPALADAAVALAGGLVEPGGPLRAAVVASLREDGLGVNGARVDAARGAALLARRLGGSGAA